MLEIRRAKREELAEIIKLISDDKLGASREDYREPLPEKYYAAFDKIAGDSNEELMVALETGELVGVFQLTFIQCLTYQGGVRAQIEGVRVKQQHRGKGIGEAMFEWAIQRSRQRKAHLLQLTTDKKRPEARRFYEKLGFVASHEGMKLHMDR